MKYAIVFVLTNMSKYAYVRYQRICTEIRLYLLLGCEKWETNKTALLAV